MRLYKSFLAFAALTLALCAPANASTGYRTVKATQAAVVCETDDICAQIASISVKAVTVGGETATVDYDWSTTACDSGADAFTCFTPAGTHTGSFQAVERLDHYTVVSTLADLDAIPWETLQAHKYWRTAAYSADVPYSGLSYIWTDTACTPATAGRVGGEGNSTGTNGCLIAQFPGGTMTDAQWGCPRDASTDCTSYIQAGIDYGATYGIMKMKLVPGNTETDGTYNYRLAGGLTAPSGFVIIGNEGGNQPIQVDQRAEIKATGSSRWVLTIGDATSDDRGCGVIGVDFEGQGAGVVQGGVDFGCRYGQFEYNMTHNFGEEGFYSGYNGINGSLMAHISHNLAVAGLLNHATTAEDDYLGVMTIGGPAGSSGELFLEENEVAGNGTAGLYVTSTSGKICGILYKASASSWIARNLPEFGDWAMCLEMNNDTSTTQGGGNRLIANRFDYGTLGNLLIESPQNILDGNGFMGVLYSSTDQAAADRNIIKITNGWGNQILNTNFQLNGSTSSYNACVYDSSDVSNSSFVDANTVRSCINSTGNAAAMPFIEAPVVSNGEQWTVNLHPGIAVDYATHLHMKLFAATASGTSSLNMMTTGNVSTTEAYITCTASCTVNMVNNVVPGYKLHVYIPSTATLIFTNKATSATQVSITGDDAWHDIELYQYVSASYPQWVQLN